MKKLKVHNYLYVFISIILVIYLFHIYYSHHYDEYGILKKQYIGNISDCKNCLIIETMDSQYSYFYGLYNVVDRQPKVYFFINEHKLNDELLEYKNNNDNIQSNSLIIKIHWHKINSFCCINNINIVGLFH